MALSSQHSTSQCSHTLYRNYGSGIDTSDLPKDILPDKEVKITGKHDDINEVKLPRKGKVVVPKHIKDIGDALVDLNMLESLVLGEYVRARLGLNEDTPDPLTALLENHQFAALTGLPSPHLGGMGGGMAMSPEMMAAMAAMAQGGAGAAGAGAAAAAPEEAKPEEKAPEKTHYNIKLVKFDVDKKVGLIKELRKIDKNLSIKDAKDLVEGAPSTLKKEVPKEEAEKLKTVLTDAGGVIELE